MHNVNDRYKIAASANAALQRIRSNRQEIQESQRTPKTDFARMIFEEYEEKAFENKVKVDSLFYKVMLRNIQESQMIGVQEVLTNFFNTVKQIYEHENIKPKIYGFNAATVFNESDKVLEENASRMINDFVNKQYYALSNEQREERYFPAVKSIASDVILHENVNEEEAVRFGSKTVVMNEFIERISFPLVIRNKIEEDLIDENYARIFDQPRLKELWEQFQELSKDLAKIVAVVI